MLYDKSYTEINRVKQGIELIDVLSMISSLFIFTCKLLNGYSDSSLKMKSYI